MKKRRYLLISPPLSVLWWIFVDHGKNPEISALIALINSFIIFYNIPWLVRVLHLKPVYYEDLEDNLDTGDGVNDSTRYKFQNYFTLAITCLLSMTFCIVLDYILYNFGRSGLSWQERIGLIGGAASLYGKIQDKIGKFLLFCMMRSKKRSQQKRSSVEMVQPNTSNISDDSVCYKNKEDDLDFSEFSYSIEQSNQSEYINNNSIHLDVL